MTIDSGNNKSISVEIQIGKPSYGEQYISGAVPLVLGVLIGIMAIVLISCQKDIRLGAFIFIGATGCILLLYAIYCCFIRSVLYADRRRAKDREDFLSCQMKELRNIVVSQQEKHVNLILLVKGISRKHVDSTGDEVGEK